MNDKRAVRLLDILHEDPGLLVINKPAGLVCHPTKAGPYSSLISRLRLYLGDKDKPHLVNRLDRETSGVLLVAKQPGAARELRQLWEARAVQKDYWAIVHGPVAPEHDLIEAALGKDEQSPVVIKDTVRPDGAPAVTEFWVIRRFKRDQAEFALLQVRPRTGRKHQIRIHLAWRGHPVVGDKLYGGNEQLYLALVEGRLTESDRARLILPFHALHAREVRFTWRGQPWHFHVEAEKWFTDFCDQFG